MSGSVDVRGVGNIVVCGDNNHVAAGGRRRNAVFVGDGMAWMPVKIPSSLRRRIGRWAVGHGYTFEAALGELARRQLDAEEP